MTKITFMGAGSTIFAKNVLGDCLYLESLREAEIALYDIDAQRLEDSRQMLTNLARGIEGAKPTISAHHGVENRRAALKNADFVVNAIQVGGYEPCTVTDFEIPKRFGLRQTIADTLGIGGIMRALRTIPVMIDFARDMEQVCPGAIMLNYTNPMAMVTGAVQRATSIQAVGLCHSVQGCARGLLRTVGLEIPISELRWEIAGINHMAWLLSATHKGVDLYPEIKARAAAALPRIRQEGACKLKRRIEEQCEQDGSKPGDVAEYRMANDLVRLHMMLTFGAYVTESSEHNAEYHAWYLHRHAPQLIEEFGIPLDEYPRRCVDQIAKWAKQRETVVGQGSLSHTPSHEYGAYIMDAVLTDRPYRIHGNVLNRGVITNLPEDACVEVACLVDRNGIQPTQVGRLPEVLAALNRTNINVQNLTIEAALTGSREAVYHAALLDPHTAAELTIDETKAMVDALLEAHGDWLPPLA